jgi:hypothetical protein
MANVIPNPSFETNTTGWTVSGGVVARVVGSADDGSAYATMTDDGSGTGTSLNIFTTTTLPAMAASGGQTWSCGASLWWETGTQKQLRLDLIFLDNTDSAVSGGSFNGIAQTVGTSGWLRLKNENRIAPTIAAPGLPVVAARLRITGLSTATGDKYRVDSMQLEQGATLPAYNPVTGGGFGTPQNLFAVATSSSSIDLDWDAVTGATGYDIERDGQVIVSDNVTNSYTDNGLSPATLYTYRVRAVQ